MLAHYRGISFLRFVNLTDIFDVRMAFNQRRNRFASVYLIGPVYLGGNLEFYTGARSDPYGAIGSFLG